MLQLAGGGGGLTAADLQRAMMSMSGMRPPPQQQQNPTSLTTVMDGDAIEESGILDDPEVQRVLLPLLAEGQQTEEELQDTMRSPQLQQALSSLQEALQTENFNGIMSSSGLDSSNPRSAEAMARGDPVNAFLQAIIHAAESRPQKPSGESAAQETKGGESGEGDGSAAEETKGGGGGEGSGDENYEGSGAGEDRATPGA